MGLVGGLFYRFLLLSWHLILQEINLNPAGTKFHIKLLFRSFFFLLAPWADHEFYKTRKAWNKCENLVSTQEHSLKSGRLVDWFIGSSRENIKFIHILHFIINRVILNLWKSRDFVWFFFKLLEKQIVQSLKSWKWCHCPNVFGLILFIVVSTKLILKYFLFFFFNVPAILKN